MLLVFFNGPATFYNNEVNVRNRTTDVTMKHLCINGFRSIVWLKSPGLCLNATHKHAPGLNLLIDCIFPYSATA